MGFKAYRVGADSLELRVQEFKVSGLGFGAWGKGLVMGYYTVVLGVRAV